MEDNKFYLFPSKRIKPFDGMEITAEVWGQAHDFHHQQLHAHNSFLHGAGIVSGFEVVASDPADKIIYIMPGAAIDSVGRTIVLAEPVAYDLGNEVSGRLSLTIGYREKEQALPLSAAEEAPHYIEQEFILTARPNPSDPTAIELARFERGKKDAAIHNAVDPDHPQQNELDLRYRAVLPISTVKQLSVGVVYLGKVKQKNHGRGMASLANEMKQHQITRLIVEDDMAFEPGIFGFNALYLVGEGDFSLGDPQLKALKTYLQQDGFVFMESCDAAAEKAFQTIVAALKINLKPVKKQHPLLSDPWHFAESPAGFAAEGELTASENLVFSTYNYGRLWFAEDSKGVPTREKIRAAMEWGQNLASFITNLTE